MKQYIYRNYDKTGNLLYVGITYDIGARAKQHKMHSHWFPNIARFRWAVYPDRRSVEIEESIAIRNERPMHNVNPGNYVLIDDIRKEQNRANWFLRKLIGDHNIKVFPSRIGPMVKRSDITRALEAARPASGRRPIVEANGQIRLCA